MRTIGHHWPTSGPKGDYVATCDYCGVAWRRSQLRKMRDGNLACPDEGPGRDALTLSEGNARGAANLGRGGPAHRDGGYYEEDQSLITPEHNTNAEDAGL